MLHKCPYCQDYETHNVHEFMIHMQEMCPAIFDVYEKISGWDNSQRAFQTDNTGGEATNLEQRMETGPNPLKNFGPNPGPSLHIDEMPKHTNLHINTDINMRLDKDGCPEDSYPHIADEWANYLEYPLSVTDACVMLALFKIARFKTTGSEDHLFDGYKYLQEAYDRYTEELD